MTRVYRSSHSRNSSFESDSEVSQKNDPLDSAFEKRWNDTETAVGKIGRLRRVNQAGSVSTGASSEPDARSPRSAEITFDPLDAHFEKMYAENEAAEKLRLKPQNEAEERTQTSKGSGSRSRSPGSGTSRPRPTAASKDKARRQASGFIEVCPIVAIRLSI